VVVLNLLADESVASTALHYGAQDHLVKGHVMAGRLCPQYAMRLSGSVIDA
jgi:hypothetical protein